MTAACLLFYSSCKVSSGDTDGQDNQVPLPAYWPTSGWQSTSPEQQGMDSGRLADLLEAIRNENHAIRSVLIVRNGYLVVEAYFFPFQDGFWHIIHSCTKSITSTLIGIAIDQGLIANENERVLDFFPEYNVQNMNQWKEQLTLKHLLMMASGLETRDTWAYNWEGLDAMEASSDWAKYVLDLPMLEAPGTRFEYSNGVAYLIGTILQKAAQRSGLDFAHQNLFSHLGIPASHVDWPMSPQDIVTGWGRMRLRPIDMAKFGFLFLHKGLWDGNRLVSEEWVDKATRGRIYAGSSTENYGYQWWVDNEGYFMALGYSGQYIIVHPEQNMVTVFTSALALNDFYIPESLYNQYILDAARSDEAIAGNSSNQARLDNIITQIANPEPQPVPALPGTAAAISGTVYDFESNDYDFRYISLTFTPGEDEAQLNFAFRDRELRLLVGLDNVYRVTWQHSYWRAYRGAWENDNTFVIDYQLADYSERGSMRLTFSGNTVHLLFRNEKTGTEREMNGTAR
jgi:CubicO group peptidase (beta-lactamase class C family)